MALSTNIITSKVSEIGEKTTSKLEDLQTHLINFGVEYGSRVLGAVIILIIGLFVARWVGSLLKGWLDKQQMEPPVRMLLSRSLRFGILGLTLVSVLEKFGVPISSLIATVGVAGLGVGLALQGLLSNLFAGLSIIFTKQFRVTEYIELAGHTGEVESIDLFTTTLLQPDTSRVVIPNRNIVGEVLRNYGLIRQLNLSVGVAYDTDMNKVMAIIQEIVTSNPRVLKSPAPAIGISSLGDSAINLYIKPFTSVTDYGAAQAEIYPELIKRFAQNGINIPFPQHQVHFVNQPKAA